MLEAIVEFGKSEHLTISPLDLQKETIGQLQCCCVTSLELGDMRRRIVHGHTQLRPHRKVHKVRKAWSLASRPHLKRVKRSMGYEKMDSLHLGPECTQEANEACLHQNLSLSLSLSLPLSFGRACADGCLILASHQDSVCLYMPPTPATCVPPSDEDRCMHAHSHGLQMVSRCLSRDSGSLISAILLQGQAADRCRSGRPSPLLCLPSDFLLNETEAHAACA